MKSMMLLFVLLTEACTQCVLAGNETKVMKATKEELIKNIEGGNKNAILELGSIGDQSVIPFLEKLLQSPNKNFGGVAANAQMALAKLGRKEQLDEILAELNSEDWGLQDHAIKKLAYVGGNESVKALVKLLDDRKWRKGKEWSGPKGERAMDKVFYSPRSDLAMKALAQIVPNPPIDSTVEPTEEHLQKWRVWWKNNKHKYK